ncbi:hypothetical protein LCGC14_2396340, partial [marine sediment metagenome]
DDRYKGTVFFGNFDFFNLLEGDISELQWATYDQDWQRSSLDSIKAETTGIVYALASWFRPFGVQSIPAGSVWNTKHDINFSGFHAYTRTIVTNIVQEVGFTYDDSAVTDSLWDELAIACPVTRFAVSNQIDNPLLAEWSKTSTQTTSGAIITFDTLIVDADALFDNPNDKYDIDRTASISFELNQCSGLIIAGGFTTAIFELRKNNATIAEKRISVNPGDFVPFNITVTVSTIVKSGDELQARVLVPGGDIAIDDGFLKIENIGAIPNHSDVLSIGDHIPKIGKKDFLTWIFALFNIQVETNETNKTVVLSPFDALLISSEQNWSKNLDTSKRVDEGITLPYAQNNHFKYAENENLVRSDSGGIYNINNPFLRADLNLIQSGFGASDGAQRKGIYIRAAAVIEYPTYIMHTTRLPGMNTTAASDAFTIDNEGAEYSIGDYIEVGGEFRQINGRTSDTAGIVSINFDGNNASQAWTLRRFELMDLTPPRIARIVASEGNYDIVQGTEDVVTSIVGGKEAVFHDDLLWYIITNSYQNLL